MALSLRGIIGMAIAGLVGWGAQLWADANGLELSDWYLFSVMFLVAAIFGLTTDRCEIRGLWASYRENCRQFYEPYMADQLPGDDLPVWYESRFNPHRRLAVLLMPLVMFPLVPLVFGAGAWILDAFSRPPIAPLRTHALYFGVNVGCVLLTLAYAAATAGLRRRCPAETDGADAAEEADLAEETAPALPEKPERPLARLHRDELAMPMPRDEKIEMMLSLPDWYRVAAVAAVFGCGGLSAAWFAGVGGWIDGQLGLWSTAASLAGVLLFFGTFARIYVTEHRIERRWLGRRKTLDRRSVRIHKRQMNALILIDGHGAELRIGSLFKNSQLLYARLHAEAEEG